MFEIVEFDIPELLNVYYLKFENEEVSPVGVLVTPVPKIRKPDILLNGKLNLVLSYTVVTYVIDNIKLKFCKIYIKKS